MADSMHPTFLEPSGIERGRGTAGPTVLPPLSFYENNTAQNNAKICHATPENITVIFISI